MPRFLLFKAVLLLQPTAKRLLPKWKSIFIGYTYSRLLYTILCSDDGDDILKRRAAGVTVQHMRHGLRHVIGAVAGRCRGLVEILDWLFVYSKLVSPIHVLPSIPPSTFHPPPLICSSTTTPPSREDAQSRDEGDPSS
jgi:hypothetical protein